jgi:hypothetical protein
MTEKTVPDIRSRGVRYWAERRGFWVAPPSTDVQDRLAGELPIDKPAGDRADLAPWSFDRDLRPQLFAVIRLASSARPVRMLDRLSPLSSISPAWWRPRNDRLGR